MEKISAWNEGIMHSLKTMTEEVGQVIPNILGAIAIIIIGWLLAKLIVGIVRKALKLAKADKIDDKINDIELFGSKKLSFNVITITTKFVKWIIYIMILIIVTDILNLTIVSEEIKNFLGYLPKLFSALIIFTVGLLLANFIKKTIKSFFESMDLSGSKLISQIVFLLLVVFISITALNQAGVDTAIITNNITLILAGLLLAFALAFGLGAQKVVGDLLKAFYARKTYEIGQKIEFGDINGEVESINHITVTLKTKQGKLIVPIKDIVESHVSIRD
ncbi:mechanosensitive ion channel domain-containing protein [Tamlana sp. 2201CG12-4]|uniref:mechanosensitive ion channel family protein n=1 Tax=Tamlana sp. 2201CG12-4 TaxID=3112582 RepID=UPI002DB9FAC8|nr:mechanosensitive ion channel domain-containing protein [Tamlana sp. 2201CG12-4]MEC3907743.1 mechanosensitive ion channel domain-containing protein [Tamlana sp. 2201CG12-4]